MSCRWEGNQDALKKHNVLLKAKPSFQFQWVCVFNKTKDIMQLETYNNNQVAHKKKVNILSDFRVKCPCSPRK